MRRRRRRRGIIPSMHPPFWCQHLTQALEQATLAGDELLKGVIKAQTVRLLLNHRSHDIVAANAEEVTLIAHRLGCAELAVLAWWNLLMIGCSDFEVCCDGATAHDIDRLNAVDGLKSGVLDEAWYLRRQARIFQPVLELGRDGIRRFILSLDAVYIDY